MSQILDSYQKKKKSKVKKILVLVVIVAAAAGIVTFIRSGKAEYESFNDGIKEYVVKANENVIAKSSGTEIKKNLYVPRKIDTSKKLIAFTFDDGPLAGNTERVVNALLKNDSRATFFMLGQNAKIYPQLVKKVQESGNEVGGHSYDHPLLTNLSSSGIQSQIGKMNTYIKKACGSNATVIRPPYGGINSTVKQAIDQPLILWSIDTLDWKTRNTDKTVASILKNAKDGDIVLMHDIHKPTVAAVEKVLPQLKAKGFEVCTVSELLKAKGIKTKKGQVVISASQIN